VSAGVNLISAEARLALRHGEPCDIPALVTRLIDRGSRVRAYHSEAYWRDIGRPSDYENASREFDSIREEFGL